MKILLDDKEIVDIYDIVLNIDDPKVSEGFNNLFANKTKNSVLHTDGVIEIAVDEEFKNNILDATAESSGALRGFRRKTVACRIKACIDFKNAFMKLFKK